MHQVDAQRLDLVREYLARPFGPHSVELQKLLHILRWDHTDDRYVVVRPERNGPYYAAYCSGRGKPIRIFRDPAHTDMAAALGAVLCLRWEKHTGVKLPYGELGIAETRLDRFDTEVPAQPILGYADAFSVSAGDHLAFKVSCLGVDAYVPSILRIRSADENGVGLKMSPVEAQLPAQVAGRLQHICAGSFVHIPGSVELPTGGVSLQAVIWPTRPGAGRQALLGSWNAATRSGLQILIDADGCLTLEVGDGTRTQTLSLPQALLDRHWVVVAADVDLAQGQLWLGQHRLLDYARQARDCEQAAALQVEPRLTAPWRIAAWSADGTTPMPGTDVPAAGGLYNGKIEAPRIDVAACTPERRATLPSPATERTPAAIAQWDFAQAISTTDILDISGHGRHGRAVNLPARAMKGAAWDGSEYNWQHKPAHYAAIHFHEDDLYDCGWATDFTWQVPHDLPSGIYCAHLVAEDGRDDMVPFVVRPPTGTAHAPLALILPTASYLAYANRRIELEWPELEHVLGQFTVIDPTELFLHGHPEFGPSMYDTHTDGSGVCYSSRLRPVLNMRPREQLWQFAADTHLTDWLEARGLAYDVITEEDIEREGAALLGRYRCVMTATHPEYPSKNVVDAYLAFQRAGGRFMYLGGNGFYWRVSHSPTLPAVIEMRRAEDGIRSWAAEGGEYYTSFTGELGGMWRRMGHAPQSVAGIGMTSQGFDAATHYLRLPASHDARAQFIFAGVGADERIGDFGLIGGGAAGWEIDRADLTLGTPPHALIVAQASDFTSAYHWMKEELSHTHTAINGETCPHVHADMVFYETPQGGAVFSTGSIAWAGALSHNDYDNNVSRITENVVRRFVDPRPIE